MTPTTPPHPPARPPARLLARARARLEARTGAGESGSVAVWMVTTAMVMVLLVGLAVDLSGQVLAKQHAQDVAAQAARAGGQQLAGGPAVRGQAARLDPARAVAAADGYIAATPGVTGHATVTAGHLVANTHTTYRAKFLGIIGITALTVTGHAEVQVVRAAAGVPR